MTGQASSTTSMTSVKLYTYRVRRRSRQLRSSSTLLATPEAYGAQVTNVAAHRPDEDRWARAQHDMRANARGRRPPSLRDEKRGERKRSRLIGSVEPSPPSSGRFDGRTSSDDRGLSPVGWRSAEEE